MKRNRKKIITITLILINFMSVQSQESNNKGFKWSISFGPNINFYKVDGNFTSNTSVFYDGSPILDINKDNIVGSKPLPLSQTKFGIKTDFTIGYGFTNNLTISYANKVSFIIDNFIHRSNYYDGDPELIITVTGITGIEFKYYFDDEYFASLSPGFSIFAQPFVNGNLAKVGFGFDVAAGYQLSKKHSLILSVMHSSGNLKASVKEEIESVSNSTQINGEYKSTSISMNLTYHL